MSKQWISDENEFTPSDYVAGSTKSAWWLCPSGHRFYRPIIERARSTSEARGCNECYKEIKHTFRVTETNNLAHLFPDIAEQWSPKNVTGPETYTPSSLEKVWWICERGHEYLSRVESRTGGKGCNVCVNRHNRLSDEYNLAVQHPELMKEWSSRNTLDPYKMYPGSAEDAIWICEFKHEWTARISKRAQEGQKCRTCVSHYRKFESGVNDLSTVLPELEVEWSSRNERPFKEYSYGSFQLVWWICSCGNEWEEIPAVRYAGNGRCKKCFPAGISRGEQSLIDVLDKLELNMKTSDRRLLGGKEVDAYFPEQNIAIEFNGIYWHSEAFRDSKYHLEKTMACQELGVQLLHIWEDDWNYRQPIVIRSILSKLNSIDKLTEVLGDEYEFAASRVGARKCNVVSISIGESREFLDENHIQGYKAGSVRIGLKSKSDDRLVAVLIGSRQGHELHIERYATACIVPGGFTRLIKAIQIQIPEEVTTLVTFADYGISDGSLYSDTGWIVDRILNPDYMYLVNGQRKHKFGYRLKKFRDDPNLEYVEGWTERQLAEINGLKRVYDAGKVRFIKHIEPATTVEEESMVSHI